MADKRLSGDWDEKSWLQYLKDSPSFIEGTNVLKGENGDSDKKFYGHLKSGSVKASKKVKGCCKDCEEDD